MKQEISSFGLGKELFLLKNMEKSAISEGPWRPKSKCFGKKIKWRFPKDQEE